MNTSRRTVVTYTREYNSFIDLAASGAQDALDRDPEQNPEASVYPLDTYGWNELLPALANERATEQQHDWPGGESQRQIPGGAGWCDWGSAFS